MIIKKLILGRGKKISIILVLFTPPVLKKED